MNKSRQALQRRLHLLYHHGYLERPRAQLDYYHQPGSRYMVYGIGNRGAAFLRQDGTSVFPLRWSEKNRGVGRIYLEHTLLVADFMVALELACRNTGIRLLSHNELTPPNGTSRRFRWDVNTSGRLKFGVVPDRVFALDFPDEDGEPKRAFFFLEADRGTMPVMRKNLSQSSFYRKLLAYEATWVQGIHRTQFNFNRFRVLTVTTSGDRIQSLVEACSYLRSGHGLFLFTDRAAIMKPASLLSPIWRSGRDGTSTGIYP